MKNSKTMERKQIVWTICWIAVLLAVAYWLLWRNGVDGEATKYLRDMTPAIIPVMFLNAFVMWLAASGMLMPYLDEEFTGHRASCIQYEVNFVDAMLPYINKDGFKYFQARLEGVGFLREDAQDIMTLRYATSIFTKWVEIAVVMVWMMRSGEIQRWPIWERWLVGIFAIAIVGGVIIATLCLRRQITLPLELRMSPRWGDKIRKIQRKLDDLHRLVSFVMLWKGKLFWALVSGAVYSLAEVMPFCLVAMAIGQSAMCLPIIAVAGIAVTAGIIVHTPMGLVGSDLTLIGLLYAMGFALAPVVVVVVGARLIVFAITASTGIPFWKLGMREIESK